MRINRKKSSPINPQSPPQEMTSTTKNKSQKNTKDQASKSISQSTITTHVKRAVEGITSKIEKNSIERIISDAETDEGCDCLIKSFIEVFDNNSSNDTIILKSLEVIYILLNTSNSTFRTKMQYLMPEILTITTLNFKKSKVKFRNSVHELAKAIYLNLQRRIPLPSPSQLELPENFPQFIPINSGRTTFHSNFNENKFSFDFDNENDNHINDADNNIDEFQDSSKKNVISKLVDSSPKQESLFNTNNNNGVTISLIDKDKNELPDKKNLDDDLIDCDDADDGPKESTDIKLSNETLLNNEKNLNIEIDSSHNHPSKAKQALDDYLKNSEQEDGNSSNVIQSQKSDNKESYDNLLLMSDDSFGTSSSVIYSSANIKDQNENDLNNNNSKNIVENLLETDPISIPKPRRPKKSFNISKKEKGDILLSPNIPRSQSLNVNMPIIIDQSSNSNLISGSQQLQNNQNTNSHDLIDSNQIIDLTKPASTPNSPTSSLKNPTQNSFLDSILNSQPNTSPANNYNSPSTFNPLSPSAFNPPSDFNSPDSGSNYNSESASNFLINSNQYSSQLSKSNSIFTSNIELGSQASLNSVSDSILKVPSRELISPSRSSRIQMIDSPIKFNSNLSFNKISDSSTILQTDDRSNNIQLNTNSEAKRPSSFRFNVKYEHLSPNSLLQKEEDILKNQKNSSQPKTKINFKIEKRVSSPQSDNSISISQTDNQASSSSAYTQKQDLFNNFESDNTSSSVNTTSNNFSNQDLFNSSVQTSTYDDFQASKPSFGLEDFDDRFEPITPVQSSNIQIFNDINDNDDDDKNDKTSPVVSPSILSSSDTNNSAESDQFITLTPKRSVSISTQTSSGIDDRFVPITPVHTSNINDSNDVQNTINDSNNINNNNRVGTESDDQFVPITPVRNSQPFIDDDELFIKRKNEGGSFNSDPFVPITPVKNNSLYSEDDQFVPITPVKNTIGPFYDDSTSSADNANNNKKNGSFDQFVPISPAGDKDIISFSDDPAQEQNNNKADNLIDDLVLIPKSNNDDQSQSLNSNSDNSLYDQFVPISPVADSIKPIFNSQNLDSNDDSNLHGIMRSKKNNIINNINISNIMGISPRSRRHLSFDSGILSPCSDKFEAITPPNARSMFYINQNNNIKNETNEKTISTSNSKYDSKMSDSSFNDQFEPITPPSSLRNQSQIDDLINSNESNNELIFNQSKKNDTKFDESLDKKINTQNNMNGNHHLVSFEITKHRKNSGEQQNELKNFPLIDSDLNSTNTNSEINFQTLTNNFSKSHENLKSENNTSVPSSNKSQNPIDFKVVSSKNNQAKRFNVYIEHNQSSQYSTADNT